VAFAAKLRRLEASLTPPEAPPPAPSADRSAKLDELRARIQAVLERSIPRPRPAPPPVDTVELPFAVEDTLAGPLHVRTVRLLPSHRTGRASVLASRHARAPWLALLALDSSLAACDPTRALYLDTETTGLNGGTGTLAFLVGLATWDRTEACNELVVEQLLLRTPGEEAPMLERIASRIREASMLVTFNGKAFDLPLLRTRFAMARMTPPVEPPHLDLVHVARRIHRETGRSCKLTAIEESVLGFVREDDTPSGEVSRWYLHFLRTGDPRALVGVVEHNAWDVVAMAALVGLYGEPTETSLLSPRDLVGVGKTLLRAGEKQGALEAVERAVLGGAGDGALLARANVCKRMGDKARALAELEALAARREDPDVLLELAKLYEHFAKDPRKALDACLRGTSEAPAAAGKRRARLEKKMIHT
jgi:uncharacterized protein YprB with RNaseH-like and TPR domain